MPDYVPRFSGGAAFLFATMLTMRALYEVLFDWWERYERFISAGALVVGFLFDLLLTKQPDSVLDNVILLMFLFVAAACIVLMYLRGRRGATEPHAPPLALLFMLQFCFGGLASNLLVLYGYSGTFAGSAVFIVLLVGMLIGNEFFKTRYGQLRFTLGVYYMLLLTYCLIAVPTFIFHKIGPLVFVGSVVLSLPPVSLLLAALFLGVFRMKERVRELYHAIVVVLGVVGVYGGLYFTNLIPPVPLALRSVGVYHSLERASDGDGYIATFEPRARYVFWRSTSNTYTLDDANTAYCFSSVYAPAELNAPVYHHWEYYDESFGSWKTALRISFFITGGREEGYRGFSMKGNLTPGRWRCSVETTSGALIGRISFMVKRPADIIIPLASTTL